MIETFGFKQPFQYSFDKLIKNGNKPVLWFILHKDSIYLQEKKGLFSVPSSIFPPLSGPNVTYSRCIGIYNGCHCMVLELQEPFSENGLVPFTVRESHANIGGDHWIIAGRASQIVRWKNDHQYCGRCGTKMAEQSNELLRKCPECGFFTYPRISPAVIMSVIKDNKILLGRSPRFPEGMYSVLAGFVESGETLEEAVAREVMEEANIRVKDIQYYGSQPWPFPHSLMVGFTARYAGGTLNIDYNELEDADWYRVDNLPKLPSTISIARHLIELFRKEYSAK